MMGAQKHISSACLSCRRRKVKCNGTNPCANCTTSKVTCEYNAQADLRKLSAKKVIASLEARLGQLEKTLRDHNIEQPPSAAASEDEEQPSAHDASAAKDSYISSPGAVQEHLNSLEAPEQSGSCTAASSLGQVVDGNPLSTNSYDPPSCIDVPSSSFQPSIMHMLPADTTGIDSRQIADHQSPQNFSATTADHASTDASSSPSIQDKSLDAQSGQFDLDDDLDDDEDITSILAARMGSLRLAEDGQLRYYGSTSNLHIDRNGAHSLSHATIRSVASEGEVVLQKLGLNDHVSPALEMHLARLYFTWEDPAIHVIDEDIFFEEKRRWKVDSQVSPYYSETLNNAICAIGACLAIHDDIELPENASEFFSARAKALLDIEMDSPTVATVQALVIMSASEAASTRDSRGWLYSGMAARVSIDLGLHLSVSKHLHEGTLSTRDLHIRQTAFWGVFIHENMWSSYVGRPGSMAVLNITAPRPSAYTDSMLPKTWKPYPVTRVQGREVEQEVNFPIHACTAANATLAEFMRRINSKLYSGHRTSGSSLFQFLGQTSQELSYWLSSLPQCLEVNVSDTTRQYLPMVLQLHMQYYAVLITLYRPYLSRLFQAEESSITDDNDRLTLQEAGSRCVAAAHQATSLLRCYKRLYSLRRTNVQIIHIIFTVALTLIHDVCTQAHPSSRHSLKELQLCCYAMGDIGQYYSSATRALETTIVVKGEWQKRAAAKWVAGAGTKRSSINMTGSHTDLDIGVQVQNKRRQFSSVSDQEPFIIPGYPIPASFSMQSPFHNTSERRADFPVFGMPQMSLDNGFRGPEGSGFDLNGLVSSDWFDVSQNMSDNGSVLDPGNEMPSI